jgi:hypothetical protein
MVFQEGDDFRELRRPGDNPAQFRSLVRLPRQPIPDESDLVARYDFSQEDGTLPITDQSGNGRDLGQGRFSGVGTTINGVQAGNFDGVDDNARTSFPSIPQPLTIAIVYEPDELNDGAGGEVRPYDGGTDAELTHVVNDNTFGFRIFAGSLVDGGAPALTPTISTGVYDGPNSLHRINGTQVASGDAGTNSLSGVTLAAFGQVSNFMDTRIGEMLIYKGNKTSIASDIDDYLGGEWGILT